MKNKIFGFIFGKDNKTSGVIALTITSLIVLGCTCNKNFDLANLSNSGTSGDNRSTTAPSNSSYPDAPAPVTLSENDRVVRQTILDFADAVDAEDFTDFREKTSKDFKRTFTVDKMNTAFAKFMLQKDRTVPVLRSISSMTPTYTKSPTEAKKFGIRMLSAAGSYPTSPFPTKFDMDYQYEGGEWKIIKIEIKIEP